MLHRNFIWILAFVLSPTHTIHAQTFCYISGNVADNETGKPLEGARIELDFNKTDLLTDSLGYFKIRTNCQEHALAIHYVGYKTFKIRVDANKNETLKIGMENKLTQLEEVVVTSQGSVRNTESPALGVSLLSLKAVQKLPPAAGEVDILRSLQTLPGVTSVGEGANGINIRGGNVDQNLIYLDNMPIFNPTHLLGLFSLFPTDGLREMQIYKGSIPARYGGRTSSVLDVKLAEPSTDKFSMKGGVGLISNRFNAEVPIIKEKLSVLVTISKN